jgi:hypothetical protein
MSIFEIIMLLCFGAAWPFSIYKSYTARKNAGKSVIFLFIVLVGYVAGVLHKILHSFDNVIYLYILNGLMVIADIGLYYRNYRLNR